MAQTQEIVTRVMGRLKDLIGQRYGMLDLLDIFAEADRLVGFTRFFTHSGTKEVRSRETLRPLLLLDLFAEGTNTGIKRVANANQRHSYDELLYVRKHYIAIEALRNANAAVVNTILARRNPLLWGEGHACASDGKRFESWRQNLMTEWRSRYRGYGVLVYWHVETNAVCIYSQLRNFSFSEVAAMIEGLIRHDTEMRVEKNFVDSHGQSEVAFAFCHLLGGVRLMPRLKRIKYERLYLPDKGMAGAFPNLAGVLSRPIRWDLIAQQYDEMVKHAVALKTGTATPEAILKRFNSYNVTHPTYKALAELGKVEKTIYLCEYLSSIDLRYEVQEGLNVIERWNAANDFLCYGRQGILATNSHEQQEISTLSLHLLQNCLMLINTLLVERTLAQHQLLDQLSEDDRRALSPLFYEHVNPYGLFELDLNRPSWLEAGLMATRVPPKVMAKKLVRVLHPQRPDYDYLKKVFRYTRALREVKPSRQPKRLPELLTDAELVALYETVWHARQFTHVVMLKLLLFTGIRNAELVQLHLMDVDLQTCQLRIRQGKGRKDRSVLFPTSFRGELAQYIERQRAQGAKYLFESNRCRPYSTRRIRQIAKHYATRAGIEKRVYPHLFRHQLITYLTKQGIISPKLQLLSGHMAEQSLAVYRELALSDVAEEYEAAMKTFPVR